MYPFLEPCSCAVVSEEVKRVDSVEQLLMLEGASVPFRHIHALTVQGMEGVDSA